MSHRYRTRRRCASPCGPSFVAVRSRGRRLWRDELDGAAEAEAERLLQRDVEEAELLELLGAAEGADVNRSEITVGDEPRDLLLGGFVVAGDEDVELLAGDLAGDQGGGEGGVEGLHDRRS